MKTLKWIAGGLTALAAPVLMLAQDKPAATAPTNPPINIYVKPAEPAAPDVSITLGTRHGVVTPCKSGCSHTGGGNIDVQSPSPDTIVVTMTGVAVAAGAPVCEAHAAMDFDLNQCLEISFDNPEVKAAKVTMEAQLIGLLRSHKVGSADVSNACATLTGCGPESLSISLPGHSVCGCQSMSINDLEGPHSMVVGAGKYTLHQTFRVSASQAKGLLPGKAPSSEFADGALDPLWISHKEPFKGAAKKDFGFKVTIKVAKEDVKPVEKVEAPAEKK